MSARNTHTNDTRARQANDQYASAIANVRVSHHLSDEIQYLGIAIYSIDTNEYIATYHDDSYKIRVGFSQSPTNAMIFDSPEEAMLIAKNITYETTLAFIFDTQKKIIAIIQYL
ncbi:hypothetical protein LIN78_11930 [Leeia sp. TBRC 13508]|uniref:Uncharacterized protein n=1 Tax=Leeia speluncae TaxID=2884804 RepID=A0ABS8D7T6_9NEIS|nr:hypothetical protein [Leeia speluncae]MCB6184253.1 hypothetical protein [Leeia speluncae]